MDFIQQAIARAEPGSLTPTLSRGERGLRPALGDMPAPCASEPSRIAPANARLGPPKLAAPILLLPLGEGRDEGRSLLPSLPGAWPVGQSVLNTPFPMTRFLRIASALVLRVVCLMLFAAASAHGAASVGGVRVVDDSSGDGISLFVENRNLAAITLTVTVLPENADVNFPNPIVLTCRERGRFPLAQLTGRPGAETFGYKVRYDWQFGLGGAKHDASAVYQLPFASGKAYRVDQGSGGSFTHTGNNEHAIDFGMPEGTAIHAARAGTVEVVVDRFDHGGMDPGLRDSVNMILIRHSDGTYGEYVHLQRGGAKVKPGQKVKARQLLGLSGNTGYSQGPHLHFAVFSPKDGATRETFPIRFRTKERSAVVPVEGETYRAP